MATRLLVLEGTAAESVVFGFDTQRKPAIKTQLCNRVPFDPLYLRNHQPRDLCSASMASYMRNALLLACVALVHPVCSERIKVDFYGEFLCPYCEKFLTKDVGHLFDTGFLAQHVDFRYVPYGNAKVVDGQVRTP